MALKNLEAAAEVAGWRETSAKLKGSGQKKSRRGFPRLLWPRGVRPNLPSDRLFEFFRRAEGDFLARLDLDRFASRRVAAHARSAFAHLQNAEAADADALALLQVLDDIANEITQNCLGLLLRHFVLLSHRSSQMLQRHR